MTACGYTYCRAPLPAGVDACGTCGHPVNRAQLKDPAFLLRACPVLDVAPRFDLHQILPAVEGMLELQLAMMRHLGIERALLQSAPPEATSLSGDARLREVAAAHPQQFFLSQYVDPRSPDAAARVAAHAAAGIRVIKLLPPVGFEPDDPALRPFWGAMHDHRMIVLAHTGFITARHKQEERAAGQFLNSRHARPVFFDDPARRFPDVTFVLAHLGDAPWCEEAAQMITQHDNVWADCSGFGLFALRRLLSSGVPVDWSKVVWGNDAPAFAYPFNLRLLVATLERAGARALLAPLLRDNGVAFVARHLA